MLTLVHIIQYQKTMEVDMDDRVELTRLRAEVAALRRENAALREDVASLRRNITAFINTQNGQAMEYDHA
jgi:cell division protein FtsB